MKRAPASFAAALEVEDAELGAEVPVRLRLEVEATRLADHALDPIGALVGAPRHRLVRQVGQAQLDRGELPIDDAHARVELADLSLERGDRGDRFGGILATRLEPADRLTGLVAAPLELLQPGQRLSPLEIEAAPRFERRGLLAPIREATRHALGIATEQISGEHREGERSRPVQEPSTRRRDDA